MNTAIFIKRALSLGISISDLDNLSIGMCNDIFIESANDQCEYAQIASQEDMDRL